MLSRVLGRQCLRNLAALSLAIAFAVRAQASPAGALYLLEQPSARAMAWGNASAASAMGVESLRSNPAGMTGAQKFELGLAHHFGADGWTYDWMGLTLPLGQWSLGGEFFTGQLDPIPDYDAFGNQTGEIRISNGTGGLGLAWRSAQGAVSLGLAGRYFKSEVAQYSNDGWAMDFGAQASLPWRIRLGLALVNVGEQSAYISRAAPLPNGGRAALQWLAVDSRNFGLAFRGEYDLFGEVASMPPVKGGVELTFVQRFILSAGMQAGKYVNQAIFGMAYEGDWISSSFAYLPGELDDGSMLLTLKTKGWPFGASAPSAEKGLLTIKLAGEESLPPLESWRLEYLDIMGKTLKTRDGDGDLPAQVAWDGVTDQGAKVEVKAAKRLRITVTDRQGVVSSNERNIGLEAKPRELQRSAPLFVGSADSLGGMRLRTQFDRELPGLKSWSLKVKDADGLLLKTIEGRGALPRSVDLGSLGQKGNLRYDFSAETDDGRLSSLGSLAKSVQPKDLLIERPSYDPGQKQLLFDIRPKMSANIKEWTLTVKSADGLVLKTISGRGPVPKELAFDPASIKLPGLDLGQRKSGSAFVQVALAYTGSDGVNSVVSDVLPLPSQAQAQAAAPVDALQADAFSPVAGREFVVLALPALRSLKPQQVARAAQLFRLPEGAESRAWAVEFLSGSRVLGRMKDSGVVPAFITWPGPAAGEAALSDVDLDRLHMRVTLDEKAGTPSVLDQSEPMRRSFSSIAGGKQVRRVHAAWFSQGEADLQPEMLARLDQLAEQLKAKPKAMAVIQGHCSKEGDAASNARLAEQRAQSVQRYLSVEKGVPAAQLSARGFSNELLLDERADEDAVRRNRRVDVVVVE